MHNRPAWLLAYNELKVIECPSLILKAFSLLGLPVVAMVLLNQYSFLDVSLRNYDGLFSIGAYITHTLTLIFYMFLAAKMTFHFFKPYYRPDELAFNSIRNQLGIVAVAAFVFFISKKVITFHPDVGFLLLCIMDITCLLVMTQFYLAFNRTKKVFKINESMISLPIFGRQLLTYTIHDLCRENVKILGGEDDTTTMIRKVAFFIGKEGRQLTPAFWNKHYDAMFMTKNPVANSLGKALLKLRKYYYIEYLFEVALERNHKPMIKFLMPKIKHHNLLDKSTVQYLQVMKMETKDRMHYLVEGASSKDEFYAQCDKHLVERDIATGIIGESERQRLDLLT